MGGDDWSRDRIPTSGQSRRTGTGRARPQQDYTTRWLLSAEVWAARFGTLEDLLHVQSLRRARRIAVGD